MALQTLGLGSTPGDGNGDDLRTGGDKINDNFLEIYNALGDGSDLNATLEPYTTAEQTKVGYITVTGAVDLDALATTYQPLDSDLTSIAALTTTSYGRGLLELADQAALQTAVNVEDGADVTDATNVVSALSGATVTGVTLTAPVTTVAQNAQTGTSYTLVLADASKVVTMSNASANTLTIPTNASVAFPTGTTIVVQQIGAGTTSVEGATGVTVNGVSAGSGDLSAQWAGVSLYKTATNTWLAIGGIGTVA